MTACTNQSQKKQVLILGGGFGGLYAALELENALKAQCDFEVTLVNRENFFLFTPMLHEIAASDLDLTNIVCPVRKLLKRVKFFEGDVESVDLQKKEVVVGHGYEYHTHRLVYDQIIISLGSVTNFFNLPGLKETAVTVKSLGDAIHLRNRLIQHLEEADTECAAKQREPLTTFVVAGGGFAGIETIASLNDFVRETAEFYPNIQKEKIRTVVIHPGEVILPELGEKLGRYAQRKLSERGVEILVNTRVVGVEGNLVRLSNGDSIRTNTLIWTAGTTPNPILESLTCKKERGRIVVDEHLEVKEWPGVWAIGDCAHVVDTKTGKAQPPTAQHALREGKIVAQNVMALFGGKKKKVFSFQTLGMLAAIGRRTGVAQIFGINFSGFIAWWLWRTIYLLKLPRFEKKFRVALDWTLDLFFSKDFVQYLTVRAATISKPMDASVNQCDLVSHSNK